MSPEPNPQGTMSGTPASTPPPADDALTLRGDDANSGAGNTEQATTADADPKGTPEQQAAFWRKEALENKSAKEELSRLRREGSQAPAQSTVTPPTGNDPASAINQLQQLRAAALAEYQQFGNASAALAVQNFDLTIRQTEESWLSSQLLKVPEKHRDQVERGIRERRYADADSALDAIVGREARGELESLRKEVDRLKGAEAQRAEGVVGTGRGIPVTASQARFIPKALSELNAELARLEQVDPAARAELSRRHRNGDFGVLPLQ